MDSIKLENWIHQVSETHDEEISCSDCLDLISGYVDGELGSSPPLARHDDVNRHLRQCKVCLEEYTVLRELAELENRGHPPSLEELKNSI